MIWYKKNLGGWHHSFLIYDASKLSSVYVVKSPVLGLQRAPDHSELAPSVLVLSGLVHIFHFGKASIASLSGAHRNSIGLSTWDTDKKR